ncbi:hypothetical protein PTUN_b0576 [Pseudoalteromonas tunicata]|uniref:Uncharacterized protein n=1 Tax=Pseudoalteromonas tunicata D2 TaxID=87626 RepID=A4C4V0_9GAMM|nr:hypothetical protein PTUN_b0576 [Pseudoalteromonas tunicata]EAR30582.1 hypothetical protein PTD2_03396 [Pseudoalteromonas tunicata D2]
MRLYNVLTSKITIVTFLFLSLIVIYFIAKLQKHPETTDLPLIVDVSVQCGFASQSRLDQLVVYVPSEELAKQVSLKLCNDEVVGRQFGGVEVFWGYKLSDSIEFLGKGFADLILAKENIVEAFMAESTYNYQAVLGYPSYTAFFISLKEKPRLDKAYFLDKTLGLIEYPTSRSGHILPKAQLKKLDLNTDSLNIRYANSHADLRDLLAKGEVDIISSYWKEDDVKRFSHNYITPISDNISGSKWYLKMNLENTDLYCAVQASLVSLAQEQMSTYFHQAEKYQHCGENGLIMELKDEQ